MQARHLDLPLSASEFRINVPDISGRDNSKFLSMPRNGRTPSTSLVDINFTNHRALFSARALYSDVQEGQERGNAIKR